MNAEPGVRNNLRAARVRAGLSQQDLAAAAGVTRQTISSLEGSVFSPSAAVALRLARALECKVEDLFWLEDEAAVITARTAAALGIGETRVAVAEVGSRWVAHPLVGDQAFRTEMIPCDGLAFPDRLGARVRLLDDPGALQRTVAIAGCTPVLSLWARAAERWHPGLRVLWTFANSTRALESLAAGHVHAAGLHLYDSDAGEFNTPFVRRFVRGQDVALVNLGVWEEGLMVRAGNPRGIRSAAELADPRVLLVNREEGAGARALLDRALGEAGVPSQSVRGYDNAARSHEEVARAVTSGEADAGVSSGCVAAAYGLDFIPLQEVRYDLAIVRAYLEHPSVRQLLATLDHRWVRSQFSVLGGYNTERTGETVAEVKAA